jgi:hypothetical protein
MVQRRIDAPADVGCFDVVYAVSDNRHRWVDIEHAREAEGYVPRDGWRDS